MSANNDTANETTLPTPTGPTVEMVANAARLSQAERDAATKVMATAGVDAVLDRITHQAVELERARVKFHEMAGQANASAAQLDELRGALKGLTEHCNELQRELDGKTEAYECLRRQLEKQRKARKAAELEELEARGLTHPIADAAGPLVQSLPDERLALRLKVADRVAGQCQFSSSALVDARGNLVPRGSLGPRPSSKGQLQDLWDARKEYRRALQVEYNVRRWGGVGMTVGELDSTAPTVSVAEGHTEWPREIEDTDTPTEPASPTETLDADDSEE